MNLVYQEQDQHIQRVYSLKPDAPIVSFQTMRAKVDIVVTNEFGPMFFIDGVLQATAIDEYIYHEFLVHPAMMYAKTNKSICILGGGDGCAARELFKWKDISSIDLYDWDKELVAYFREHGKLWNQGSLKDKRVNYIYEDISKQFISSETSRYDVILVDLLDPEYASVQAEQGFWNQLLQLVKRWRKEGGSIVINCGGITPWQNGCFSLLKEYCKQHFPTLYCIPYKVFVPSFGREWAYLLLCERDSKARQYPPFLRRFNHDTFRSAYLFEPDFKIESFANLSTSQK